jgi:hypothetical protein
VGCIADISEILTVSIFKSKCEDGYTASNLNWIRNETQSSYTFVKSHVAIVSLSKAQFEYQVHGLSAGIALTVIILRLRSDWLCVQPN